MRTRLNLSSRPFTNRRLFWVGIVSVFFIAVWSGLWIMAERDRVRAQADQIESRIKSQQAEVERLRRERAEKLEAESKLVLTERDRLELASARQLIGRRSFSWNRMIGDIERFVPNDTRITSIRVDDVVGVAGGSMASVEVKAAGKTAAEMTGMMSGLERSGGLFTIVQANQEAATQTGEIPFTLNLSYSPSGGGR